MNRLLKDPAAPCTLSSGIQLIRTPCCSGCCCKIKGIAEPIENFPDWSTNSSLSEDDCFGYRSFCLLCSTVTVQMPLIIGGGTLFPKHYITLQINPSLEVDITYDGAIRMKHKQINSYIAINADSTMAAMNHKCGQVYKNKDEANINIYTPPNHKYAKLTGNAIKFKKHKSAVLFVTDDTGTKTSADTLIDLHEHDYTERVFQQALTYGEDQHTKCNALVKTIINTKEPNVETWEFKNNVTVYKEKTCIRVTRKPDTELMISSSGIELYLPGEEVYMYASECDDRRHFFVRSKQSRVRYDGTKFSVCCDSQSAGFDESDQIFIS